MWPVPRPDHDLETVYRQCVGNTQGARPRLLAALPEVLDAAERYEKAASSSTTHLLRAEDFQSKFGKIQDRHPLNADHELKKTYSQRFAGTNGPGREIYDELVHAVDTCPLCGHRPTGSLDHVLPKTTFPMLAVTPINLVPSCVKCNTTKLEGVARTPETVLLNPYFDDIDGDQWLIAEIQETRPVGIRFSVNPPEHWSDVTTERAQNHFCTFGLADLYAAQVGRMLTRFGHLIERTYRDQGGAEGLRLMLHEAGKGHRFPVMNTWEGAMFDALSKSDWYCNGGFRL